jgi:hypothetical protein
MARHCQIAPTSTLPASLILTPQEQKHYRRYQRTNTKTSVHKQGFLPSAEEYTAFQCWLKQRDSGYFSDEPLSGLASYLQGREGNLADLCKHALHPSHRGERQSCCPVCIVEMHMRYLRLLKDHVIRDDGKVPQRWESTCENTAVDAWRAGKLSLLRTVESFEEQAAEEEVWTNQNPGASIENAKTAQRALQIYHAAIEQDVLTPSSQSPESGLFSIISATSSPTSSSSPWNSVNAKPRRNVCFDADTIFAIGRSPHYFWRRSPRYEAGKYAACTPPCSSVFDSAVESKAFLVENSMPTAPLGHDDVATLELDNTTYDDEANVSVPANGTTHETEQRTGEEDVYSQSGRLPYRDASHDMEGIVEVIASADAPSENADCEWQELADSDSEFDTSEEEDEDEDDEDEDEEEIDCIVLEEEASFIVFAD